MDPKLVALLKKLEADGVADLKALLVPAVLAEIQAVSPAGAQAYEAIIFAALQPAIQQALESLLAKLPA
jgi:hypothetical protein